MSGFVTAALTALVSGSLVMLPGASVPASGAATSDGVATVRTFCAGYGHADGAAVGSPGRDVGDVPDAGVVVVRHPFAADDPGTVITIQDLGIAPRPHDRFGAAVVWANLSSGDRIVEPLQTRLGSCPDLVVGVPGANEGRGAVVIIPDFGAGLELARAALLPVEALGLQPGDALGAALGVAPAAYGDSVVTLVAGAPGRDLAGAPNAGALVTWTFPVLTGDLAVDPAVPAPRAPVVVMQGSGGILGKAERSDRFGSVISAGWDALSVGIPREDVGRRSNAGAVAVLRFADGQVVSNDLLWLGHGLPGKPRAGDKLGAAVAGAGSAMAIGAPGRDSNGRGNSGAVLVCWRWSETADPYWRLITQNTRGVPDRSERGDAFGSAVATVAGRTGAETSAIAIGVPGEDYGRRRNVGAVTYLDLFPERQDQEGRWAFGTQPLPRLSSGDRFGSSLVRVPGDPGDDEDTTDTVLVGAPGEDVPGARNVGRYWRVGFSTAVFATGVTAGERMGL